MSNKKKDLTTVISKFTGKESTEKKEAPKATEKKVVGDSTGIVKRVDEVLLVSDGRQLLK